MRFWCALGASLLLVGSTAAPALTQSNIAIQWNDAALQGLRDTRQAAPVAARTLAIVHTCMYDAWAAYDDKAVGTQLHDALRRPASERTLANKEKAISYAAYRALSDLLPAGTESVYKPLMKQLGYDPSDNSTDIETPTGIGNVACAAVLEFRHHDKSNQLGELAQGPYSDWTHFRPVNMPSPFPMRLPTIHPIDLNHWQPLIYVGATGDLTTQMFTAAQWCYVTPFAMSSGDEFRGVAKNLPPAAYSSAEYRAQAEELIKQSAGLTDEQKMLAEYWSDAPDSESAPARWDQFAQWVSARDHHSLDDDVMMFFALNNALLDASIAAWDMKREFDSVRPVTAVAVLFHGIKIRAWGGPGKGTVEMDGADWIPYQNSSLPTPSSPEYVSGESTFAAAAATILVAWSGNDRFGYSLTLPVGSSKIEPGITPAHPVVLTWQTFTDAADEAGMSRRYGGIHFRRADVAGQTLGRLVAQKVWSRAQRYFVGAAGPQISVVALTSQR
jgi:PAP2 superfamily